MTNAPRTHTKVLVTAAALITLLVAASGANAGPRFKGAWPSQNFGDYRVHQGNPVRHRWKGSWDCKLRGCADGEARAIRSPLCLHGRCARLRIGRDSNNLSDSVGYYQWRHARGGDGFGVTNEGQGTRSHWYWAFRFGAGFPTRRSERGFVNITEWHSTGFAAHGHSLVINAQEGRIRTLSSGWDGRRNGGRADWSCTLARKYKRGVWYKIRVSAHWSVRRDAWLRVRLGRVGRPGWSKTCARHDRYGNLFMDPNRRPDEIYMAQNLYRSVYYHRRMVIYYDDTRQGRR